MLDVPVVLSRSLIDGVAHAPHRIGTLHDPNTGAVRTDQVTASPEQVEQAVAAADRLYRSGMLDDYAAARRVAVLQDWAVRLDANAEAIAQQDSISTGNPLRTTRLLASFLGDRVRSATAQLIANPDDPILDTPDRVVRVLHRSLGPALVLAPWNAPTFVAVSKVAAAFAAGSPVILKPSEWTPSGAQLAAELLLEVLDSHEAPRASVQLVHGAGQVGAALASDARVRVITFTGGLAAGKAVARAAAETLAVTQLELGSNNPAIVLPDADVAKTASAVAEGITRLNGQWCEAPGKILVPPMLHDSFIDALRAELGRLRIESSLAEGCELGPLAYAAHRDRLAAQLDGYESQGADVVRAGRAPDLDGWFFTPAIVSGIPACEALDELFGPVVTVHAVPSVEEAVEAANSSGGGLDAFVFGRDEPAALEVGARVLAGEVRINGTHMADLADGSEQTFWGMSGVGGHGPAQGVPLYQGRRVVGVDSVNLPL